MEGLVGRDEGGIGTYWVFQLLQGDKVGLELGEVAVEFTFKSETACRHRNRLSDQSVQVTELGVLNVKLSCY